MALHKTCERNCERTPFAVAKPRIGSALGSPWSVLKTAIKNLYTTSTNQNVNFWLSIMQAGNTTNDGSGNVTTVTLQSSNVTHTQFISNIDLSWQQWKGLLEFLFNNLTPQTLTVNFQHRTPSGDETGISVPSSTTAANYSLTSGAGLSDSVGDFRVAMEAIDGPLNVLAFAYGPGGVPQSIGNVGGDCRVDKDENWRAEGSTTGNINIVQTLGHEFGHALSLGHDTSTQSLMYPTIQNPTQDFLVRFPGGLKNSQTERFTVNQIYGGTPSFFGVNAAGELWRRTGLSAFDFVGSNWSQTSATPVLNRASLGPDSSLWAINSTGQVLRRIGVSAATPDGTGWTTVSSSPAMVEIAVGVYGQVYALDASGNIYQRANVVPGATGTNWVTIAGALTKLSCAPKGGLVGVNSAGQVWYRNVNATTPLGTSWSLVSSTPVLTNISIGYQGLMWGTTANSIVFRTGITDSNPLGTGWSTVAGAANLITVGPYGGVVIVNSSQQISVRTGVAGENLQGSNWQSINGAFSKSVSAGWLF